MEYKVTSGNHKKNSNIDFSNEIGIFKSYIGKRKYVNRSRISKVLVFSASGKTSSSVVDENNTERPISKGFGIPKNSSKGHPNLGKCHVSQQLASDYPSLSAIFIGKGGISITGIKSEDVKGFKESSLNDSFVTTDEKNNYLTSVLGPGAPAIYSMFHLPGKSFIDRISLLNPHTMYVDHDVITTSRNKSGITTRSKKSYKITEKHELINSVDVNNYVQVLPLTDFLSDTTNDFVSLPADSYSRKILDSMVVDQGAFVGLGSRQTYEQQSQYLHQENIDVIQTCVIMKRHLIHLKLIDSLSGLRLINNEGAIPTDFRLSGLIDATASDATTQLHKAVSGNNVIIYVPLGKEKVCVQLAALLSVTYDPQILLINDGNIHWTSGISFSQTGETRKITFVTANPVLVQTYINDVTVVDIFSNFQNVFGLFKQVIPHRFSSHFADQLLLFGRSVLNDIDITRNNKNEKIKYSQNITCPKQRLPLVINMFEIIQPQTFGFINETVTIPQVEAATFTFKVKVDSIAQASVNYIYKHNNKGVNLNYESVDDANMQLKSNEYSLLSGKFAGDKLMFEISNSKTCLSNTILFPGYLKKKIQSQVRPLIPCCHRYSHKMSTIIGHIGNSKTLFNPITYYLKQKNTLNFDIDNINRTKLDPAFLEVYSNLKLKKSVDTNLGVNQTIIFQQTNDYVLIDKADEYTDINIYHDRSELVVYPDKCTSVQFIRDNYQLGGSTTSTTFQLSTDPVTVTQQLQTRTRTSSPTFEKMVDKLAAKITGTDGADQVINYIKSLQVLMLSQKKPILFIEVNRTRSTININIVISNSNSTDATNIMESALGKFRNFTINVLPSSELYETVTNNIISQDQKEEEELDLMADDTEVSSQHDFDQSSIPNEKGIDHQEIGNTLLNKPIRNIIDKSNAKDLNAINNDELPDQLTKSNLIQHKKQELTQNQLPLMMSEPILGAFTKIYNQKRKHAFITTTGVECLHQTISMLIDKSDKPKAIKESFEVILVQYLKENKRTYATFRNLLAILNIPVIVIVNLDNNKLSRNVYCYGKGSPKNIIFFDFLSKHVCLMEEESFNEVLLEFALRTGLSKVILEKTGVLNRENSTRAFHGLYALYFIRRRTYEMSYQILVKQINEEW